MTATTPSSLIDSSAHLVGNLRGTGSLFIEGTVEGNVEVSGEVVIAQGGKVVGNIQASSLTIEGEAQGDLQISGVLALKATSRVQGQCRVGAIQVEEGAQLSLQFETVS